MTQFTCPQCGSHQIQGAPLTSSTQYSWQCTACLYAWDEPIRPIIPSPAPIIVQVDGAVLAPHVVKAMEDREDE
ncbi:MAG: hypothetical protein KGH75_00735 [Rhodospirillales bacterium]|nr:hypothetical protein [Rhodospirillales bacterium]